MIIFGILYIIVALFLLAMMIVYAISKYGRMKPNSSNRYLKGFGPFYIVLILEILGFYLIFTK